MDWTFLEHIWNWLLPAGWLATAVAWWRDRKIYRVRAVKETEGTYKSLYDDLSATVIELSTQLREINKRNIKHETAIHKCYTCRYADRCPAVIFLRQQKVQQPNSSPLGQSQCERNRANHLRAGPEADSGPEGECGGNDTASGPS